MCKERFSLCEKKPVCHHTEKLRKKEALFVAIVPQGYCFGTLFLSVWKGLGKTLHCATRIFGRLALDMGRKVNRLVVSDGDIYTGVELTS